MSERAAELLGDCNDLFRGRWQRLEPTGSASAGPVLGWGRGLPDDGSGLLRWFHVVDPAEDQQTRLVTDLHTWFVYEIEQRDEGAQRDRRPYRFPVFHRQGVERHEFERFIESEEDRLRIWHCGQDRLEHYAAKFLAEFHIELAAAARRLPWPSPHEPRCRSVARRLVAGPSPASRRRRAVPGARA